MSRASRPRPHRRWLLRAAAASAVALLLAAAALRHPAPFFAHRRAGNWIQVGSDEPVPERAAKVIDDAEQRVRRSPLFDAQRTYPVYVCNHRWRWNTFSGFDDRSRAFETSWSRAVFTRRASWEDDRLAGPDGAPSERPLAAYLAHEVTHMLVVDHLGVFASRQLPAWVAEGYPEYVARGDAFDYDATRARLLAHDEDLVTRKHDPYVKYVLLVAHLLDREEWDVATLLRSPPRADDVEARVREGTVSPCAECSR